MSARRTRMLTELRDPVYRESYAEHHLNSVLATQIRTVREQRGLTQERLAKKIEKHQAAISRIENVNYARWNVRTLKKVANALGCWLDIRLESWGKLVEAVDQYSTENLRRERFEDAPCFGGAWPRVLLQNPCGGSSRNCCLGSSGTRTRVQC
jgi:transcriptional regulator with XRE-family HTH domain